jgi:SAM-dependent methyltransferase
METEAMTQNIYDKPEFFQGYSQLERSIQGLTGAPEWPALRALLPDLQGLKVVDLGCGFGWFCRWASEQGAKQVLGLDVSENMLAHARTMTTNSVITYNKIDLAKLELPEASFDLAYSSLVFHYIEDFAKLVATIHRSLVPGGRLVFSIEHPILMAPTKQEWLVTADGRHTWPIDRYLAEGRRTTDWLTKGVIKYHRTLGTTLNHLIRLGFTVTHVEEWGPTAEQIAVRPEWAKERERPMFLLISAQR